MDALPFFQHCSYAFYWANLSSKTVMDVGCGRGTNSTKRFVEMFPDVGKVIAIDRNMDLIDIARQRNRYLKIEYHVANIAEWSSLEQWEGQIDIVVSHYCFNCVSNKVVAFQNVHRLLKSGGTAAILFTLQTNCYDWAKEVGERYSQYAANVALEPPDTHMHNIHVSSYQQSLFDIGFYIVQCDEEYQTVEFASDDECKRHIAPMCPVTKNIPSDLKDYYIEEIFLMFLKYNPRNERGLISFTHRTAKILIKKK